jgi:hypothetical protein
VLTVFTDNDFIFCETFTLKLRSQHFKTDYFIVGCYLWRAEFFGGFSAKKNSAAITAVGAGKGVFSLLVSVTFTPFEIH